MAHQTTAEVKAVIAVFAAGLLGYFRACNQGRGRRLALYPNMRQTGVLTQTGLQYDISRIDIVIS